MAVPLIVRVLPYGATVGSTPFGPTAGGALVEIYGGNFRLPPDLGAEDLFNPLATTPATVSVTFGGAECPRVSVARSNLLRVATPPSPLPYNETQTASGNDIGHQGTVDVVVTNLDDNGDPIVGETATLADAYTYTIPGLTTLTPTTLTCVVRSLLDTFRRDLLPNTLVHQSVEFDSENSDLRSFPDIAKIPAIALLGPRTAENRLFSRPGDRVINPEDIPGTPPEERYLIARMPFTIDLAFDMIGITNSRETLFNLMDAATRFVHRTPYLFVPKDSTNLSKGTVQYDFGFESAGSTFSVDPDPNESDLHTFRGAVVIKGVDIERFNTLGHEGVDAVPGAEEFVIGFSAP